MPKVDIDITETRGGKLTIGIDPCCLDVNGGKQTITFKLNSREYSFLDNPAEAIKFKANNQFGTPTNGPGSDTISVLDKNTNKREYEYAIQVEHNTDGKILTIDPLIKNNT